MLPCHETVLLLLPRLQNIAFVEEHLEIRPMPHKRLKIIGTIRPQTTTLDFMRSLTRERNCKILQSGPRSVEREAWKAMLLRHADPVQYIAKPLRNLNRVTRKATFGWPCSFYDNLRNSGLAGFCTFVIVLSVTSID